MGRLIMCTGNGLPKPPPPPPPERPKKAGNRDRPPARGRARGERGVLSSLPGRDR
jgi:hypothetical protein